ncbi:MAG: hypothetical protein ACE5J2_04815 [Nitrososphaerales archaeon]
MNKKQRTMLVSITIVTLVGAMLLLSGVLNMHIADAQSDGRYGGNSPPGNAAKIIVEIESPFGFERITSFKTFNTDNLMKRTGYFTLKLQGPIMDDKRTLLHWIAQDIGKMPDGLAADGIETHGGRAAKMTKPREGVTVDMIPMTGKVTLLILEYYQGMFEHHQLRKLEFSGCHVAGYHLGTLYDNDRPYLEETRIQHYEQVDFACTNVKDLKGMNMNSRQVMVERAMGNEDREIMNEKGELLITSREYRQPIVMNNFVKEESAKSLRQEVVTTILSDKVYYKTGDVATFTVTFTDLEGNGIDPDAMKAYYDGKMIQLERQNTGVYTYVTLGLTKAHHQLIINAEKVDFAADTTYLTIPMHRIS